MSIRELFRLRKETIRRFLADRAIFGTVLVTVSLFVSGFLNYLLQIFLGRSLTILEYGEFNALLSLSYILGIPSGAISTSLIKVASELKAKGKFDALTRIFIELSLFLIFLGVILGIAIFLFRGSLALFLNLENPALVNYYVLYASLIFVSIVPVSYLQGLLRFKAYSFLNVLSALVRLSIPVLLVIAGFKLAGVFVGLAFATLTMYFIGSFLLRKNLVFNEVSDLREHYSRISRICLASILISLGGVLLFNTDVILVKHYLDSRTAGLYSAISTVGKVFIFGAGAVYVVMFPQISELVSRGENVLGVFKKFLKIQLSLVLLGVLAFSIFPGLIVSVLFGARFSQTAPYLPLFSVFTGLYVLSNFFVMFFLALNKMKVFILQISASALQFLLINLNHSSLREVINMNVVTSGLLIMSLLIYYKVYVRLGSSSSL